MSLTFGPQTLVTRTAYTLDEKPGATKESQFRAAG